jgi:uncharacterized protein (TIGR02145 family)
MKRLIMSLAITSMTLYLLAQSPQKMSYQCVIRNASGVLVTNQSVGIRISILGESPTGDVIYQEIFSPLPQTNANGLVSIEIGGGAPLTGTFSSINWGSGTYFLKTETDPAGGTNYTVVGTSQLLSVPYALYANKAGNGFSGNYNDLLNKPILFSGNYNDLNNKPILFNGSWINVTDKPTTIAGFGITDAVTTTGDQTIAGNKTFTGTISAGAQKITNVADPVNLQDAATKAYVDNLKLQIKALEDNLITSGSYRLTDVDGNQYKVVKIGNQTWMAENLKSTHYRNGTKIPGYKCYNDDSLTYKAIYGVLVTWNTASSDKYCPTGWHLPSNNEWTTLNTYLGGTSIAGGKLKETGTIHWKDPNAGATNESGFSALPGGELTGGLNGVGGYTPLNEVAAWWSRNQYVTMLVVYYANAMYLGYDNTTSGIHSEAKQNYLSVRCLKDVGPILTTDPLVTNGIISSYYVYTSGGQISEDKGMPVTHKGICWNTTGTPDISSNHTDEGPGTYNFKSTFMVMFGASFLYIRSYATNSEGTGYGNEIVIGKK